MRQESVGCGMRSGWLSKRLGYIVLVGNSTNSTWSRGIPTLGDRGSPSTARLLRKKACAWLRLALGRSRLGQPKSERLVRPSSNRFLKGIRSSSRYRRARLSMYCLNTSSSDEAESAVASVRIEYWKNWASFRLRSSSILHSLQGRTVRQSRDTECLELCEMR